MTTYPSHFAQSLAGNHGAMAYLKASPSYHMNGLALGMSHGLDALQSQSLHYGGGELNNNCIGIIFTVATRSQVFIHLFGLIL